MRKRKRVLWLGVFAALVMLGLAAAHWRPTPDPGVSVENFERLTLGMTDAEVEAILGRPGEFEPETPRGKHWREDGLFISVGFGNHDGTVNYATANVPVPGSGRRLLVLEPKEPLLERVRRFIGL